MNHFTGKFVNYLNSELSQKIQNNYTARSKDPITHRPKQLGLFDAHFE